MTQETEQQNADGEAHHTVYLTETATIMYNNGLEDSAVRVNAREYITQHTPGFHLCNPSERVPNGGIQCLDGAWISDEGSTEFYYSYTNDIVDYIAQDSTPPYAIGSIRNHAEPELNYVHRCFSNPGQACAAPTDTDYPPQAVPTVFKANVVTESIVHETEHEDGSPRTTIPGAVTFFGWQQFGVNVFIDEISCDQIYAGDINSLTLAVLVDSLDFGGDIGEQRHVLIIDEIQIGHEGSKHIERYFYAKGYGRIREGSAWDNDYDDEFDDRPYVNSIRNQRVEGDLQSTKQVSCFQGTSV